MTTPPRPSPNDPHARQPLLTAGASAEDAAAAIILIHGRGASAESILPLHKMLGIERLHAVAPQAAGNTWYPHSFMEPIASNQPYLDSALNRLEAIVVDLVKHGLAAGRIALFGFSQGACLVSEFVARHPRRYGAAMALSGGLIGPPSTPRNYAGRLDGTPIFLGSSDPDAHVPFERVTETEAALARMGADVQVRRYPGMGHTINQDEMDACRLLMKGLAEQA